MEVIFDGGRLTDAQLHSIGLAVRYEATVLVAAINEWL